MDIKKLNKIVEGLRSNDADINNAFSKRRLLVKDLTDEEFNYVYDKLYNDKQSHWEIGRGKE